MKMNRALSDTKLCCASRFTIWWRAPAQELSIAQMKILKKSIIKTMRKFHDKNNYSFHIMHIGHDLSKIKKSNIFTANADTSFFKRRP